MAIDTSGQVTIRGEGSATTTNLQQGLAKVWLKFNQDTPSTLDSFNVTSVTDSSTGLFLLNIANDFNSVNHTVMCTHEAEVTFNNNVSYNEIDNSSAGQDKIYVAENGAVRDCKNVNVTDFGDLA